MRLWVCRLQQATVRVSNAGDDRPVLVCQRANLPPTLRQRLMVLNAADRGTKMEGFGAHTEHGDFWVDDVRLVANQDGIGQFEWFDTDGTCHTEYSTAVKPDRELLW